MVVRLRGEPEPDVSAKNRQCATSELAASVTAPGLEMFGSGPLAQTRLLAHHSCEQPGSAIFSPNVADDIHINSDACRHWTEGPALA